MENNYKKDVVLAYNNIFISYTAWICHLFIETCWSETAISLNLENNLHLHKLWLSLNGMILISFSGQLPQSLNSWHSTTNCDYCLRLTEKSTQTPTTKFIKVKITWLTYLLNCSKQVPNGFPQDKLLCMPANSFNRFEVVDKPFWLQVTINLTRNWLIWQAHLFTELL